jgi:hypothetical protein
MKKIKIKVSFLSSPLLSFMVTLLKEIFCIYPHLLHRKHKVVSRTIEIVIIHNKTITGKNLNSLKGKSKESKLEFDKKTKAALDDWSMIAVNDENGTVNTVPALVLSEEESKNLQKILAKYDL